MVASSLPSVLVAWIARLSGPLHARVAWRLAPVFTGILFARGRQTVAAWLRAGGLGKDFRRYYYFLGSLGRKTNSIAGLLLHLLAERLAPGARVLLALDDTPTKRFGPKVEGAGIHHNPTPGPADQKFLYGHVWVTLAWLCRHVRWGTIALPLLAKLYVRKKDIASLAPWYQVPFRTKLQQGADLVEWAAQWLKVLGKPIWVVADGAYAKRPFLGRMRALGVVVVSRLRKDAALLSLPQLLKVKGRGRPRKYGTERIDLAKRAGQKRGWIEETFVLYGKSVRKKYKTFLATYRPAYGLIRVVLVKEKTNDWVAFFCTDPNATVAEILEAVADQERPRLAPRPRSAIEQDFHDLKEVHGAGKQQVRNYWANLAVYHLNLWMHTLIELWAWNLPHKQLCDRSSSPWDDPARRPSHADRRNALRRACLDAELTRTTAREPIAPKLKAFVKTLFSFAS